MSGLLPECQGLLRARHIEGAEGPACLQGRAVGENNRDADLSFRESRDADGTALVARPVEGPRASGRGLLHRQGEILEGRRLPARTNAAGAELVPLPYLQL